MFGAGIGVFLELEIMFFFIFVLISCIFLVKCILWNFSKRMEVNFF